MPRPSAAAEPLRITDLMHGGGLVRAPVAGALIAANLVAFAATLASGAGLWHLPNDVQLAWGASFGPVIKDGEWWRLREQASRALAEGLLLHDYKLISDLAALLDTDGRCLYNSPS